MMTAPVTITPEMIVWLLNSGRIFQSSCYTTISVRRLSGAAQAVPASPNANADGSLARINCYRGRLAPQSDASDLIVVPADLCSRFLKEAEEQQYRGAFILLPESVTESVTESASESAPETENAEMTASELAAELHAVLEYLLNWDRLFSTAILSGADPRELLGRISEILPLDFCVSDLDMNLLYRTEGYAASRSLSSDDHFPAEVFQDLISHTEFHQVAKKKESFYYYTAVTDTYSYCTNIFVSGEYIGRLVILLPYGESVLECGGEELCRFCGAQVQALFDHCNLTPRRHSNDAMHQLCRTLAAEEESSVLTSASAEGILRDYGWSRTDTYSAIVLRFTTNPGWDAHLSLTLPYLAADLERSRPNACAVSFDSEILLIVNHTRDAQAEERRTFLQWLAYFVRDNICKAGVSPYFSDLQQLRYAKQAADAALRLGIADKPYLWYYLFDDLRLSFLMEKLEGSLPTAMLCHPAITTLTEYDRVHGSELARTLQVYLTSNLNMTAAADALYIHRTSFCRRMNHIRSLTGLNLEDADTILALLISYRLAMLSESTSVSKR